MAISEKTLRRRALRLGYQIEKGYVRYLRGGAIARDDNGATVTGYNVINLVPGCLVRDCHNDVFDHLFSLKDVFDFLREADEDHLFVW